MESKRILGLYLHIDVDQYNNFRDFEDMRELLLKHGIDMTFNTEENVLSLIANERLITRNAGRRKKYAQEKEPANNYDIRLLKLSDIEKMQETMKDDEIVSKLNLSRSTFYRHLKKAKEKRANSQNNYDPFF